MHLMAGGAIGLEKRLSILGIYCVSGEKTGKY
jgi:hypothetical protein